MPDAAFSTGSSDTSVARWPRGTHTFVAGTECDRRGWEVVVVRQVLWGTV